MTNAIEYIRSELFSTGYNGNVSWKKDHGLYMCTGRRLAWSSGICMSEDDLSRFLSGETTPYDDQILEHANELQSNLSKSALKWMEEYQIDFSNYSIGVDFDTVTCEIQFNNSKTGARITLTNVYFNSDTGEILLCVPAFG